MWVLTQRWVVASLSDQVVIEPARIAQHGIHARPPPPAARRVALLVFRGRADDPAIQNRCCRIRSSAVHLCLSLPRTFSSARLLPCTRVLGRGGGGGAEVEEDGEFVVSYCVFGVVECGLSDPGGSGYLCSVTAQWLRSISCTDAIKTSGYRRKDFTAGHLRFFHQLSRLRNERGDS